MYRPVDKSQGSTDIDSPTRPIVGRNRTLHARLSGKKKRDVPISNHQDVDGHSLIAMRADHRRQAKGGLGRN